MSTLDEIIEEAGLIWLRERDHEPCSLRRARLRLMCAELARAAPVALPASRSNAEPVDHWPMPDWKSLAAHDDTFAP